MLQNRGERLLNRRGIILRWQREELDRRERLRGGRGGRVGPARDLRGRGRIPAAAALGEDGEGRRKNQCEGEGAFHGAVSEYSHTILIPRT